MPTDFRKRALHEAGRYGPDPWVFVRELLQNARDAGASQADIHVQVQNNVERVSCRDDGCGMTFEHARQYLFTLYASSKENEANAAGRFGVGFWSILRFNPQRIIIRSCGEDGQPWEVTLDGDLQRATRRDLAEFEPGTEIILERASGDGDLARRVHDAAYQSARYLHQRDNPRQALEARVNGEPVNAPFSLPAPSVAFQRGAFRGVVGLGPAPRIELFSRGLRVRSAATLQDLLSAKGRHTDRSRVHFPELPSGLAPQAILESEELEVLLSRGDVRDNRALRRLVRRAHQELTRLVNRQLALARPWWVRFFEAVRDRVGGVALGFVLGAMVTVPIAWWFLRDLPIGEAITSRLAGRAGSPTRVVRAPSSSSYSDLSSVYSGPRVDVFQPGGVSIDLTYEPADTTLRFAALTVEGLDERGQAQLPDGSLVTYRAPRCRRGCVDVRLRLQAGAGITRIPVPTGHRVEPGSVYLDGSALTVQASAGDEAVLVLERPAAGVLTYRTGPAPPPSRPRVGESPELPQSVNRMIRSMRRQRVENRVPLLVNWVSTNVRYANSPQVARLHETAARDGKSFVDRSLEIGAGDCDVQNGLLTALLHSARVPARMAIGYIGSDGRVAPQLHAWVEYYDGEAWRTADASRGSAPVLTREPFAGAPLDVPPVAADASPDGVPPLPELRGGGNRLTTVAPTRSLRTIPWAGLALTIFGLGLLLVGLGLLMPHVRTQRAFYLDQDGDVSELLKGALQRPEAFRHISALFHSRLVPCLNGRAISLMEAWERAAAGDLFRSDGSSALAKRAVRRGRIVLDDSRPEGRAVAAALGATDLDFWDALLGRSRTPKLFEEINRLLRASGESWRVHVAANIPEMLVTLDMGKRGILPAGVTRVVLVDQRAPWIDGLRGGADRADPENVFRALDLILDFVDLPTRRRAELLRGPARRALRHRWRKTNAS